MLGIFLLYLAIHNVVFLAQAAYLSVTGPELQNAKNVPISVRKSLKVMIGKFKHQIIWKVGQFLQLLFLA